MAWAMSRFSRDIIHLLLGCIDQVLVLGEARFGEGIPGLNRAAARSRTRAISAALKSVDACFCQFETSACFGLFPGQIPRCAFRFQRLKAIQPGCNRHPAGCTRPGHWLSTKRCGQARIPAAQRLSTRSNWAKALASALRARVHTGAGSGALGLQQCVIQAEERITSFHGFALRQRRLRPLCRNSQPRR